MMNPFLVGYIGMLGVFLTHAIARASYAIGKEQAKEVIVEKRIKVYEKVGIGYNKLIRCTPDMTAKNIEVTQEMEKFECFANMPPYYHMDKYEENDWRDHVKRDLEERIFDGLKPFMVFEEIEDERGEPPFRYKTFRSSIFVGKKK